MIERTALGPGEQGEDQEHGSEHPPERAECDALQHVQARAGESPDHLEGK